MNHWFLDMFKDIPPAGWAVVGVIFLALICVVAVALFRERNGEDE